MPRTPEVCPSAFCPLSHVSTALSSPLRIPPSASCLLPHASFFFRLLSSTVCLLLLLLTNHSTLINVHAQGATATLSGIVTDQNDAVIPNVNIAIISIAQGFKRSATTNTDGAFV